MNSSSGSLALVGGTIYVSPTEESIRDGVVPPTVSVTDVVSDYELDLVVGGPRHLPVRSALVVARGYGGFNAALVVRRAT